eukprot:scaffold843_cov327-Prasinococcus_capsulatus_cf.AAC.21
MEPLRALRRINYNQYWVRTPPRACSDLAPLQRGCCLPLARGGGHLVLLCCTRSSQVFSSMEAPGVPRNDVEHELANSLFNLSSTYRWAATKRVGLCNP